MSKFKWLVAPFCAARCKEPHMCGSTVGVRVCVGGGGEGERLVLLRLNFAAVDQKFIFKNLP